MRRAVIGLALVLAAAALSPGAGAATAPSPAPVRVVHGPKPPPPHPPPTDGCITDQSLVRQCDKLWRQCYVRNQQQPAACTGPHHHGHHEATLYVVSGRAPLARMIDCFYDRVERDDLLSPLFPAG